MIFNEGNVNLAVCLLVVCITCSGLKVHTGDTQDQTSSRPNTLFDDADDIQRQLDNEARDRFKYGRPKAIWILNIPTQIPLITNTFDCAHRRPRNLVTSATWKNIFDTKSKSNKKNDIKLESRKNGYFIESELNFKNNAGPKRNNDIFLVTESNNKNNKEPEQSIDYDLKKINDDKSESGPTLELNDSIKPGSTDITDIKDSDSETGAADINPLESQPGIENSIDPGSDVTDDKSPDNPDYETELDADNNYGLGLPLEVNNPMDSGSDGKNDIKQELDNPDYETGIDVDNDLGPSLDVTNSVEPEITIKEGPNKPFYTIGPDDNNNPGSPLDVKSTIESGAKQDLDNLDYVKGAEDKNNLGPAEDVKNAKESGPDIDNNDLKQGPDIQDSATGAEDNNNQGPQLDLNNAKELGPDVNSDVKQEPDISDSSTQSAEVNNNLGAPIDDKNVKEAGPDINNDVKPGPENPGDVKDGDVMIGSSSLWNYKEQDKWVTAFPHCGLHSQSPVDLPSKGLVGARGARPLTFINYDAMPLQLRLKSDGNTVTLSGDWEDGERPLIYGGAGHSRRYRFHSLTLHGPSEHTLEKFLFPLETQVLHVSTDYATFDDAVNSSAKDHLAFLGIVNIYKYGCRTAPALKQLLKVAAAASQSSDEVRVNNAPLSAFCPPFDEYACYHGSLTTPPCTEAVLWLVRGRALPLEREVASAVKMAAGNRIVQPLNDRRVILFSKK